MTGIANTLDDFPFDAVQVASPAIIVIPEYREIMVGAREQYTAKVSHEDYEFVVEYKWNFKRSRGGNIYVRRGGGRYNGVLRPTILLHNVILDRMGMPRPSEEHTGDHANRDTLDNRRDNLRWMDRSGQNKNRRRWG